MYSGMAVTELWKTTDKDAANLLGQEKNLANLGKAVGTINTKGGDPFKEVFVNHQLDNGTGANWAADPMSGGLTASLGPCSTDSNGGDGGGEVAGPSGNDPVLNPRPGKLPHSGR